MTDKTENERNQPLDALNAAIDAARRANPVITGEDGRLYAAVPHDYKLQDISNPYTLRYTHVREKRTLHDRASLTLYANRFSTESTVLIADYDSSIIRAVLDYHAPGDGDTTPTANHTAHIGDLVLRASEEFSRWDEMQGKMIEQAEFARFIEENVADVTDPDHSTLLEICRDLEATQGVTFKSGVRLDNGDRSFTYQDETHVKGDMAVPTEIGLAIPLYHGEEPTPIRAKFRFRISGGGLNLGFVWHRVEYQRQAVFRQMTHQIAEDTGLPLFFGNA